MKKPSHRAVHSVTFIGVNAPFPMRTTRGGEREARERGERKRSGYEPFTLHAAIH
jgi:hypothetical protein